MADASKQYRYTAEAEALLVELDDSNTISSYKNERAARLIRQMLSHGEIAEGYIQTLEGITRNQSERIQTTVEYLNQRSHSNGVIPRALDLLQGTER